MVQGRRLRLEEVISQFIGGVGPFVAIGKPGEPLPAALGRPRAYLPDDGWQEVVLRWMNESRAILMVAGLTKWVDWELQQVVLHGYTSKLIVLFPPDSVEKSNSAHFEVCGWTWGCDASGGDPRLTGDLLPAGRLAGACSQHWRLTDRLRAGHSGKLGRDATA